MHLLKPRRFDCRWSQWCVTQCAQQQPQGEIQYPSPPPVWTGRGQHQDGQREAGVGAVGISWGLLPHRAADAAQMVN